MTEPETVSTPDKSWWTLASSLQRPSARWLGLFRRAPTITLPRPDSLVIEKAASTAQSLTCETLLNEAQVISHRDIAPAVSRATSVVLTSAPDSEISPLPAKPRPVSDTYEDRLWQRLKLQGPSAGRTGAGADTVKRLAYILQPPTDLLLSRKGPLGWHKPLFAYQEEGIRTLLMRDALLLADDMGLGKTIQVIAALRILAVQRQMESALVVVPASLISQWRREVRTWAPELRTSTVHGAASERAYQWGAPAHVYLTSYETLRSDFTGNPSSPPRKRVWDVVVLDEAQKIKNRDTEASRKCKLLARKRAWVMTGTPLENRLEDLASILEFLSPLQQGGQPARLAADSRLLDIHKRLQLRRKKSEVLPQLPPKSVSRIILPLTGSQRRAYDRAEADGIVRLRDMGGDVRIQNVLELILRLKQICNFCPQTGESAKLEDIRERLETLAAQGHRALIFSQFTDERFGVNAIASRLRDYMPVRYTGSLDSLERQMVIEAFKRNPSHRMMVLSLRAGGQGLNLQEASYVFHFDRWWNPAVEHQAEDRTHRLGQELPVHVYKYTCENTIEERIENIIQRKQALFDEVVDDVSIDIATRLTAEELFGLFGLTPPAGASSKS